MSQEPDIQAFEFEVHRASQDELKAGLAPAEVVKLLVPAEDSWTAYRVAVDVAWRPDRMVVACHWAP